MRTEKHTPRPAILDIDLATREAENLAKFTEKLESQRFWDILPAGETEPTGLLDTQTYLIYKPDTKLIDFFKKHKFLDFYKDDDFLGTFHVPARLLWRNNFNTEPISLGDAKNLLRDISEKSRLKANLAWRLPNLVELRRFAQTNGNPYRAGDQYRLKTANGGVANKWQTSEGCTDTDLGHWGLSSKAAHLFACRPLFANTAVESFFMEPTCRGWRCDETFTGKTSNIFDADKCWQSLEPKELMLAMLKERMFLTKNIIFRPNLNIVTRSRTEIEEAQKKLNELSLANEVAGKKHQAFMLEIQAAQEQLDIKQRRLLIEHDSKIVLDFFKKAKNEDNRNSSQ